MSELEKPYLINQDLTTPESRRSRIKIIEVPQTMCEWLDADLKNNNYLGIEKLLTQNFDWAHLAKNQQFRDKLIEVHQRINDKLINHELQDEGLRKDEIASFELLLTMIEVIKKRYFPDTAQA